MKVSNAARAKECIHDFPVSGIAECVLLLPCGGAQHKNASMVHELVLAASLQRRLPAASPAGWGGGQHAQLPMPRPAGCTPSELVVTVTGTA